jgi:[glutamine synthetase] adenylyltransferase / [glutamine synthetase]-adenylyl-L-tyrosine phosphorylase
LEGQDSATEHLERIAREGQTTRRLEALARQIDARRAEALIVGPTWAAAGLSPGSYAHLLATAYPALAPSLLRDLDPGRGRWLLWPGALEREEIERSIFAVEHGDDFRDGLRIAARRIRLRIALRELLPADLGGADVHATARELSDLADATIEAALGEATAAATARFGAVRRGDDLGRLVVLGLGKLGGRELNAGSDVDIVCFYDSDAAMAERSLDGNAKEVTPAHLFWTKVVQRMSESLSEVTAEGFVWRVDHRLRPEGARGALVNSLAAAERYYETFGRLWERAAFLRARVVAGDRDLGGRLTAMLTPFVWTRRVDPTIAEAMYDLVHRARAELSRDPERDLKLGPGGIREAEFFVQALQLIWGGREARVRERNTLRAAQKLLVAGLVTEREAECLTQAYLALRRTEHAIQWSSGVQTHSLPHAPESLSRLARALGHRDAGALVAHLEEHCTRVATLLSSLLPEREDAGLDRAPRWQEAVLALDRGDYARFVSALSEAGMEDLTGDGEQLARDLFETTRQHPDGVLGVRTRERHRPLVETLLEAVADAADPAQAARFLRGFAARVHPVSVYTRLLADEPAAMRRLVTAFGASAFVGEAVSTRPELADLVLFERAVPTPDDARDEVLAAVPNGDADDLEAQVGRLRRAKQRITMQVALADLADEIDTRGATLVLSALADATLDAAAHFALDVPAGAPIEGLAIVAMGKLGGREIGYGSDLDVIFVFDPAGFSGDDPTAFYARRARRIIQIIGMPHYEGRGYELDTRLRPSGSQGLLVVSREAFARYHAEADEPISGRRAATWERLALLRARFAAGDANLGARVIDIAQTAAYDRGGEAATMAADIHRLRERMEAELARERPGRHDLKLGRGGLVDIEFAVQLLQLTHGEVEGLRTTETRLAIEALARAGVLARTHAQALRDGYAFLRRLEQRIRVLHGDASQLIEADAAGLVPLARRMGIYDVPAREAPKVLIEQYVQTTEAIRAAYDDIVVRLAEG